MCAFKGWNDAGESASSALTFLGAGLGAERFAVIDPEEFVDFQSTRPTVRLSGGEHRVIEWPDIEVHEARVPRAPRDLVIVTGPEPAYRWRTFCATIVELAEALGVQMVVTLGALLADVPHSRPVGVTAFASDDALVDRLRLDPPTYEGPTGIVGVLHDACANAGMPSASLWAAVPHYVAVVPNPKGSLALLRRLESLIGITVDAAELEDAAAEYERQVSRAVEMDPDVQAFVERLERAADEEDPSPDPSQIPSGDLLARVVQLGRRGPAYARGGRGGPRAPADRPRVDAGGLRQSSVDGGPERGRGGRADRPAGGLPPRRVRLLTRPFGAMGGRGTPDQESG